MAKRKKRTRLRAWGRWSVWVCTGLITALVVFSTWFNITGSLTPTTRDHVHENVAVGIVWSRVFISYPLDTQENLFELYLNKSSKMGWFVNHETAAGWWKSPEVWNPIPRVHKSTLFSRTSLDIRFSLLYPMALMIVWSYWLMRGRRKLRRRVAGCCVECGYSLDGLNGDVCPECGAKSEVIA